MIKRIDKEVKGFINYNEYVNEFTPLNLNENSKMPQRLPRYATVKDKVICKETLNCYLMVWKGLIKCEKL